VIHLMVPPLRERRDDIPTLAEHFLAHLTNGNGNGNGNGNHYTARQFAPEAVQALVKHHWPGNVRELQNVVERLAVTVMTDEIRLADLPTEIRVRQGMGVTPRRERRRTVADDLYKRLIDERQSFWAVVYPLYMQREITKSNVRDLVRKGLEEARGNYKIVARIFNMEARDYKRFLNFLRKHDCQVPFKEYR